MRSLRFLVLLVSMSLLAKANAATQMRNGDASTIRVLFIGNSLTYTNDLPGTLTTVASQGSRSVSCASVTRPGYALIDHLDGGSNAVDVIRQGGWDYVILQQGPSSLPESRDILIDGTVRFNVEIRAVGAITSLYMVWPDLSRFAYFEAVRQNYKAAADTVGGLFLPGGEAWLRAWERDSSLALYGSDDFHPSPLGTYLVALVIYERITGADARDLPTLAVVAGNTLNISGETVQLLQFAAHAANARYTVTGVDDSQTLNNLRQSDHLSQNFPNPCNPSTTIQYHVAEQSGVRLQVFDLLGREVATLVDGVEQQGMKSVTFDARNLAGGVYYYRLNIGTLVETKKFMLIK